MPQAGELSIGGFVPFTTVDFPGRLSAVVFCQGCPWRCRYCHNPHLQPFISHKKSLQWEEIDILLQKRQGFLEAVVFSGGEPTAQPALIAAIRRVKELGYFAGLHTAGIYPDKLKCLLSMLDWVGLDIKAPFDERYDKIVGRTGSGEVVAESLKLLLDSGIDYELRTTIHPALLNADARESIRHQLAVLGAHPTKWQDFRPEGCSDQQLIDLHQ